MALSDAGFGRLASRHAVKLASQAADELSRTTLRERTINNAVGAVLIVAVVQLVMTAGLYVRCREDLYSRTAEGTTCRAAESGGYWAVIVIPAIVMLAAGILAVRRHQPWIMWWTFGILLVVGTLGPILFTRAAG